MNNTDQTINVIPLESTTSNESNKSISQNEMIIDFI